jgi:hypothetical protein
MLAINSLVKSLTTSLSASLYFSRISIRVRIAHSKIGGDLANAEKAIDFLVAMLLSVPWVAGQSTFGGIVGVVNNPSQGAVAKRPSLT